MRDREDSSSSSNSPLIMEHFDSYRQSLPPQMLKMLLGRGELMFLVRVTTYVLLLSNKTVVRERGFSVILSKFERSKITLVKIW
jgi:hypothetical protein